ncbi:hypothetical protein Hypma_005315 [Hypsizygus marmoreus]|uniref:Protein kinase domain-containing protein n=1 Tax=Hypsizygus marmoreus TaxID=39966 RepID=A0A369K2A3_HYPMA|nr:hypothetical protein Hypma_005315 [Hypsizygus marmoreus]
MQVYRRIRRGNAATLLQNAPPVVTPPKKYSSPRLRSLCNNNVDTGSISRIYPYSPRAPLDLHFVPETGGDSRRLSVDIIQPFLPFTNAVALLVTPRSLTDGNAMGLPDRFFVKISDRRYTSRESFPAWSPYHESTLRTAIERNLEDKPWINSFASLGASRYPDEDEEDWIKEMRLYDYRKKCHDREVAAYRHLRSLQGTDIPRFYGTFRLPFASTDSTHENALAASILDYAEGMALEYVNGLTMAEVRPDVDIPRPDVERAAENTLQIMKRLRDLCVVYNDCRPQNVLIRRQHPHNPVLIDFGSSEVKPREMTVEQWRHEMQGINEIKDMRYTLSHAGVHLESPYREWAHEYWGYSFFNSAVEDRDKKWRERFYDAVAVAEPGYVTRIEDGQEYHWEFAHWKLKPGVKTIDDHRYD